MNKSHLIGALCAVMFIFITLSANAALIGRLPTTPGGTNYQAYYDDVLNISFLANANLAKTETFSVAGIDAQGQMDWHTANDWIVAMNGSNYLGLNDWRLPELLPANGTSFDLSFSNNGSTDKGTGDYKSTSELSYNFHINLDFAGHEIYIRDDSNPSSTESNPDYLDGGRNTSPFNNLSASTWDYWYGTSFDSNNAFQVFNNGDQGVTDKSNQFVHVWAVHSGDVGAVPVPAAVWLFGSGLLGLIGIARRKKAA